MWQENGGKGEREIINPETVPDAMCRPALHV